MAFPATVSHFELPAMWSIFFFIMVVLMGLTTMLTLVETIVTAILDEYSLLRTNRWWRIVVLAIICCTLYLLGLPLTTQVNIHLILIRKVSYLVLYSLGHAAGPGCNIPCISYTTKFCQ